MGKESNKLEEVEAGLEHDPQVMYTAYADPRRDPWQLLLLPVLRDPPAPALAAASGLHSRSIPAIRHGHRTSHSWTQVVLTRAAADFARSWLQEQGVTPLADVRAACAAYLQRRRLTRP